MSDAGQACLGGPDYW